jgi:tRNA-specific 2-thiouridylase
VAVGLGIPHYVADFREEFGREVMENFAAEYFAGRTPNPCINCNRTIKWGALLRRAESLGAGTIATGHYARLRNNPATGRTELLRSVHAEKDQSYALWAVPNDALGRTLFPLGEMSKPEVRALAADLGLATAQKNESFDICFVPDNDYRRFLAEWRPAETALVGAGDILLDGEKVGAHEGYLRYTIGQRSGIGAHGEKMYVTGIDAGRNAVTIGRRGDLMSRALIATRLNFVSVESIPDGAVVQAQVRYRDHPEKAVVSFSAPDTMRVEFASPKQAVTPGQSVVLYDGDMLLAGGVIERAER